jgi:hypothetical protein
MRSGILMKCFALLASIFFAFIFLAFQAFPLPQKRTPDGLQSSLQVLRQISNNQDLL